MPLNLSAEDKLSIEKLADRLVAETLRANEEFAAQGYAADPSCWKPIKEKDHIVAYLDIAKSRPSRRERLWSEDTVVVTSSPQNPTLYPTSDRDLQDLLRGAPLNSFDDSDSDDDGRSLHHDEFTKFGAKGGSDMSVLEKFRPADVPIVFSSGVLPGTVEDMAFAFLADTDERSRLRFNTNKDCVVEDMRILAKIHGPTKDNPFQFLGVKWCSHTPSRTVSLVVKPRDYLVIESTGMAFDSKGERFSYYLNHSIEMDEVPTFREFGQCTVKKLLPVEGSRGRHMKKKELEFCLNCYLRAKRLPAWHVAVATLAKD
ncbi:Zinc finger, FYVE/PHD-type [Phytophthora cinnamomi]|uniref:Zinc finger, FYVE/PHD-type n=1 Tax=Phytophthora cinnamomi TaxID=4785 RepID=UPI00355A4F66|nr:Zinc finger, FYVE/PHD-type [Phytophthora cinnamomi]